MKLNKYYSISIIIPMIDEINSLEKTLKILNKIKCKKEYLIIISKNKTPKKVIDKLMIMKKKKYLKFYYQKEKFVGGAIKTGISKANSSHIAIMAADLETNPEDLSKMIKISKKNKNMIISADRWMNNKSFSDYGIIKLIFNKLAQIILKFLYGINISDFTFAYRIYPKKALLENKITELKHGFALEILLKPVKKGYKVISFSSKWKARVEGKSNSNFIIYFSFLKVLITNFK
jgi:hypothetical protein